MTKIYYNHEGKVQEWCYKPAAKHAKGATVVYLRERQGSEDKLTFQVQDMEEEKAVCPFGISNYGDDPSNMRRNLDMSLGNDRQINFWRSVDEHNVQMALQNSEAWFGKVFDEEKIRDMYYPLVVFDETGKGYPPRLHTKVNVDNGSVGRVNVLEMQADSKYRVGGWEKVKKYEHVLAIIEIGSMWFQKKQFGMSLTTTDIIVYPQTERVENPFNTGAQALSNSATDENEEEKTTKESPSLNPALTPTPATDVVLEGTKRKAADASVLLTGVKKSKM